MSKMTPREARRTLGLSIIEVAEISGLSTGTIRQIESNKKEFNIHWQVAELLAEALACSVNELEWPKPLTHVGRPPLTGRPLTAPRRLKITETLTLKREIVIEEEVFCPTCYIAIPRGTARCDYCR